MNKTSFASLSLDSLATVTGGYHDLPEPNTTSAPRSTQGCAVGEPDPTSIGQKIGELAGRVAPWIELFSR